MALLAVQIADHARLMAEDSWQAVTLKQILRDATSRAAREHSGGVVTNRSDDDLLVEFPTSADAVCAAQGLCSIFRAMALRLNLSTPPLCGAIHYGEVRRWRTGQLVGEAADLALRLHRLADTGNIIVTEPAATHLGDTTKLQPRRVDGIEHHALEQVWVLTLETPPDST